MKFTYKSIEQLLDMATYFIENVDLTTENLNKLKDKTFEISYAITTKIKEEKL